MSYPALKPALAAKNVLLVAVSKMQPVEKIQALYDLGQRDFIGGEECGGLRILLRGPHSLGERRQILTAWMVSNLVTPCASY